MKESFLIARPSTFVLERLQTLKQKLVAVPISFDIIVADHTVVKANVEEGAKGETVALVMKDGHTQFRHVYPSQSSCFQPLSVAQGRGRCNVH